MRIAIVNDMQMAVEIIRRIVVSTPGCEIAWIAYNGLEAVEKCACDTPDLIIMDMIMPKMDGVKAIQNIMKRSPCAILVVTATVEGNSSKVFEALGAGALDAINTPLMKLNSTDDGGNVLRNKIQMLRSLIYKNTTLTQISKQEAFRETRPSEQPLLVAIGASTGGPNALCNFFSVIPGTVKAAFIIIQHIDKQFAPGLATWLASSCSLDVKLAENGDFPAEGRILLAATNDHMVMDNEQRLRYSEEPQQNPFRPSVDVFFNSIAEHWKTPGMAVLMTGIGRDGAEGLLNLKRKHWMTFAQDKESSVVYGMPKAAAELNAAEHIMPPHQTAETILNLSYGWKGHANE